jgi:tetratricopeptide (TPR) repeat protein
VQTRLCALEGTMKKCINFAAMLLFAGMCAAPLWAQLDGTIRGTVKGQDGKPLAGATVQISDANTGRKYSSTTNSKGEYVMGTVYAGTYKATLTMKGNPIDEQNNIPLSAGQEQIVNWDESGRGNAAVSPEQQAKIEAANKENEKIKGLNDTLKQAKELEGQGNWDQAITILTQATTVDPNQDLVWAYLGDAQRGAKKYSEAADSYQKALALKPTSGPYMNQLADAYAKSNQTDKAIQQYAAAATADPTNAGAYYFNEGAVLTNTGKLDDAIAAFDKSIQIDPTRADAYYWKGVDLIGKATTGKDGKMQAPAGTAEAFNKYLELQPNGKYAQASKDMLATIGASVETTYGKSKKGK